MQITVRQIRNINGYNIRNMASLLEIPVKTYRLYERHPELIPPDMAIKIAKIGRISVDYIFFG